MDTGVVGGDEDRYLVVPRAFASITYTCVVLLLQQCLSFSRKIFQPMALVTLLVGVGITAHALAKSLVVRTIYF